MHKLFTRHRFSTTGSRVARATQTTIDSRVSPTKETRGPDYLAPTFSYFSEIRDNETPPELKGNNRYYKVKPCWHLKVTHFPPPRTRQERIYDWSPYNSKYRLIVEGQEATENMIQSHVIEPVRKKFFTDDIPVDVRKELAGQVIPTLETGFSLTNFLVELPELKSVFRILNFKRFFDASRNGVSAIIPLAQETRDQILCSAYGRRPLVSDYKAIRDGVCHLYDRLKEIEDNARQPIRNVKEAFRETSWTHTSSYTFTSSPLRTYVTKVEFGAFTHYILNAYYSYTCPEMGPFMTAWNCLRDALGIRFDLATLWNLIPFSFVVDQFWSISKELHKFRARYYVPTVTFLGKQCVSAKTYIKAKATMIIFPQAQNLEVPMGEFNITAYHRLPMSFHERDLSPQLELPQFGGGVNLRNLVLDGCLVSQFGPSLRGTPSIDVLRPYRNR